MAPARRQNFARSRSRSYNAPPNVPIPPPPPNQDLMPPSSRYLHNLRVIQRHDPSITSLFDQFPHVCVYHHKGDEWQKKGCEGAMFLFEREEEPKYGFYILNRNNTGDYIQRMTPEDDVEFASAYLIYRAYGKVTSDTIGLWTMVTQDREAMSQVMMRLHDYIKRDVRYPDEYRRRPDTWSTTPAPAHAQAVHPPPFTSTQSNPPPTSMSNLSTLLAKLGNTQDPLSDPSPPNRAVSASVPPPTGIPLLDSIFASASEVAAPIDAVPQSLTHGESVFHALFTNGATASRSSSASTSCGPTPTQHVSELPTSSSTPPKTRPMVNGTQLAAGRSIFPYPGGRNGRETAPPTIPSGPTLERSRSPNSAAKSGFNLGRRRRSAQHLAIPDPTREETEEGWEEQVITNVGEGGTHPRPSSRRSSVRKAKKRERERDRRRSARREAIRETGVGGDEERIVSMGGGKEVTEWQLVDDRSFSLDEEEEVDGVNGGLGDGLLDALAAVSEPELLNGPGREHGQPIALKKRGKERVRDRRKRKHKDGTAASQTSERAGDASSSSSSHPMELRGALLDAYGSRRRVGDGILGEGELAKEVIDLINNDPTFVRELHQQYLRKVQV